MNNDVKTIVLRVNGEDAKKKINELTQRIEYAEKAKERLDKVASSGGTWTKKQATEYARMGKEIDTCRQQLSRMKGTGEEVARTLRNISGASVRDLNKTLRTLQSTLNSGQIARGSKEWNTVTDAIRRTKEELGRVRAEQEVVASSSSRLSQWGNKWLGVSMMVQAGMEVYDRAMGKMREYVDAYASMEEAQSQVIKYTGMNAESVRELNEAFKQMDTRTPREKLNALAGDAGRLGIQSKNAVLEFVQAADQINVALGEDLGEDAVKNIGKLAQLFGDDKRMGLKGAMLATGSVINDLAQSSSASEAYIVDFTARLAGVGKQANMTQADIMAFGSVLDQNMVTQEKGATALQNVITAIYRKPAEMAKIAGLDVKKFTELIRTNGNEAVLSFLQALNKAGRMDALAPLLKDMELSGAGITQTLSTLAANIDQVRATQLQAAKAFQEGTSVTEESAKANATAQAQMEKAQKQAHDLAVTLGEQLYPIMANAYQLQSSITQLLLNAIPVIKATAQWIWNNKGALVSLAVALASVYALTKAELIASKVSIGLRALQTAWTLKQTIAERGLLTTLKASTSGQLLYNAVTKAGNLLRTLAVVSSGLLRAAYMALTGQTGAAAVAQTALNVAMTANPVGAVVKIVLSLVAALGTLLGVTSLFTSSTEENNAQLDAQKEKLSALAKAREAAAEEMASERTRIEQLTRVLNNNNLSLDERQKALAELKRIIPDYHAQLSSEGKLYNNNTSAIDQYIAKLEDLAMARAVLKELEVLKSEELKLRLTRARKQNNLDRSRYWLRREQQSAGASMAYGADGKPLVLQNATAGTLKQQQAIDKHTASLKDNTQALDNNLREQKELTDYLQRNEGGRKAMLEGTTKQTASSKDIYTGRTYSPEDEKKAKKEKRLREAAARKAEKERKKKLKQALHNIDQTLLDARTKATANLSQGIIDLREYEDTVLRAELTAAQKRTQLYKAGTDERLKAEEAEIEASKKLSATLNAWSIADAERTMNETLAILEEQHVRGILSEQAYHQARNLETLRFLARKRELYREAGNIEEFEKASAEYEKESQRQKEEQHKAHLDRIKKLREKFNKEDAQTLYQQELDDLQEALNENLITEEVYLQTLARLRAEFEEKQAEERKARNAKDGWDDMKEKAWDALPQSSFATEITNLAKALNARRIAFAKIEDMERKGVLTHQQAEERKAEISQDKTSQMVAVAQTAYATIGALAQSASQLTQANYDIEAAKVTARYDAEIKAVGESTTRGKMIEEKKQRELAALKNKANKKALNMQMAQALAEIPLTAMAAYNSAVKTPIIGPVLAPIAATAAVAAGMMQIATLKKQQEAQKSGYYSGGFTGGRSYRREAGVVHEGEFVANHKAVNNRSLLPVLQLIDHAQKTNTVASLTAEDVSRSLPLTTATAPAPSPVVVSTTDARTTDALEKLNANLSQGITATVSLSGPDGLDRQWRRFKRMNGDK